MAIHIKTTNGCPIIAMYKISP